MTREELAKKIKSANNGHLGKKLEDLVYCNLIRKNIVREKEIKKKMLSIRFATSFAFSILPLLIEQKWNNNIGLITLIHQKLILVTLGEAKQVLLLLKLIS